jgi:diguanylate cyclase (GGDEF)-like protein
MDSHAKKSEQMPESISNAIPSGKERRAYERYPLNLEVWINFQGATAQRGIVRDFCVGGMYLAFDNIAEEAKVTHLCVPVKNDQIDIHCLVPAAGSVDFMAQVVRKQGDGFAVRFLNPDLAALQILLDYVKSLSKKHAVQDGKTEQVGLSNEVFNGKNAAEIIESCNLLIRLAASSMIEKFHEDVVNYLFEISKTAVDITTQNAYFDALKVLNDSKTSLRENFSKAVEKQVEHYSPFSLQYIENNEIPTTASSLSIMDDEVFDDWLADTETVDFVESRNKKILTEIEKRLSLLYNTEITRVNNPYGPTLFTHLFHEILKPLDLQHKVNLACYKVFRNILLEFLDGLYSKVNQCFIDNDVMSVIHCSTSSSTVTSAVVVQTSPVEENYLGKVENIKEIKTATKNIYEPGQDLYQLVGKLRALQQQLGHNIENGMSTGLTQKGNPEKVLPKEITNLKFQSTDDINTVYSREEIQTALTLVDSALDSVTDKNEIRDFKAEVMQVLSKSSGNCNKNIGVRESQIIDVASNIFYWIETDLQVSEKIRNWIEKLKLPVIKIAIDDETLFTDRSHLVRQVINKVTQLEVLIGESGRTNQSAVKKALDWIVDLVNNEFDGSTEVFSRALHQLDLLLNVQNKSYNANLENLLEESKQEEIDLVRVGGAGIMESDVIWDGVTDKEKSMWIKRANRLKEGDWVVVDANTPEPKRLRIAWKAIDTKRIVFANVRGAKDIILHTFELAKKLYSGSIAVLENVNESAIDRAQYSMLQDLHKQLLFQSTHDQLTGLISRHEFEKRLAEVLSLAKENQSRHAVCFIDLDQFNIINSACGYEGGDQLLKEISDLFSGELEESWVFARLGSDEFGLLLKNCALDDAFDFVEKLLDIVQDYRLQWGDKRLSIGFSVGLVPISHLSVAENELLQAAESSCGVAKEMGGNRIQLYSASHAGLSRRRKAMKWAVEIDRILDENTLYLRCQRIIPISENVSTKSHYEILLGVWDSNGGDVSTPEFIEAAERFKRMPDVDRWVVKNSLHWIAKNHQFLTENIDMFSINLSGRSLNDESFLGFVLKQIHESQVPVEKVAFEVTETTGVENLSEAADFIMAVKETGCLFSLDDFGTGMSSYAYLKNLPVNYLKIDGAFVKDIVNNSSDYAVVKSICEIGHFMGKKVIAEFVENAEILAVLKELGVDYAQGYGIEKPRILADLVKNSS